jgi:hypothetical protein
MPFKELFQQISNDVFRCSRLLVVEIYATQANIVNTLEFREQEVDDNRTRKRSKLEYALTNLSMAFPTPAIAPLDLPDNEAYGLHDTTGTGSLPQSIP